MRFLAIAWAAILFAPVLHPADQDGSVAAFLEVHNKARAAVGAPPLAWSARLAAHAQDWANQLARSGKFEHRPNNPYGENLAAYSAAYAPEFGARLWLGEQKDYHGEVIDSRNFHRFGHYTQMVWRKTTHVGYGMARQANGIWILVANYDPPGNVQGARPY
jgi:uncharacterized protein YkwD